MVKSSQIPAGASDRSCVYAKLNKKTITQWHPHKFFQHIFPDATVSGSLHSVKKLSARQYPYRIAVISDKIAGLHPLFPFPHLLLAG